MWSLYLPPIICCNKVCTMRRKWLAMVYMMLKPIWKPPHNNRIIFWWKITMNWPRIWNWCCKVSTGFILCRQMPTCTKCSLHKCIVFFTDTANVVIDRLEEKSKAISLTQLVAFGKTLPRMKEDLARMKEITNGLRVNASQLSDGECGRQWNAIRISFYLAEAIAIELFTFMSRRLPVAVDWPSTALHTKK